MLNPQSYKTHDSRRWGTLFQFITKMWFLFMISTWLFLFFCFLWGRVSRLHCCYSLGWLNVGVLWRKLTATLVSIHWMLIVTFCLHINIVHRHCLKSLRGQHCQQPRSTALELLDKAIYCHNLAIHIIIRGTDCHSNWHCSICPIFALQSLPLLIWILIKLVA